MIASHEKKLTKSMQQRVLDSLGNKFEPIEPEVSKGFFYLKVLVEFVNLILFLLNN